MRPLQDLSEASDHELLARAREGDQDACRAIVRRYGQAVYDRACQMVCHHEQAEDLTQETFAKMFRALERNPPQRNVSAWLDRIARNTVLDYVRLKRPDSTRSQLTMTPGRADLRARPMRLPGDTPSRSSPDLSEYTAALDRALRRLRPVYRRCLTLRLVEHRSCREIAKSLGLPLSTVKSHLRRATQQLKRMLNPEPPFPVTTSDLHGLTGPHTPGDMPPLM